MKIALALCSLVLLPSTSPAQHPWREMTVPSVSEAARNFKAPPREYGASQSVVNWNGTDSKEVRATIVRDLDRLSANGIFIVNLSPGTAEPRNGAYPSAEYMDQLKFTVAEMAKRNMRLWIKDESDYPSGFAGPNAGERYPELGMQAIVADIEMHVLPGQTLTMPVPIDTLAAMAVELDERGKLKQLIPVAIPADGELKWAAPNALQSDWKVVFLRHVYLSGPTRIFNAADRMGANAVPGFSIDFLDAKSTDAFMSTVHESLKQAVGDQFGKTILGFIGDTPSWNVGLPWTATLQERFKAQKRYDLMPYIPQWFLRSPTEKMQRASADYYDLWSGIFRDTFFKAQADWASKNNIEYLVHLSHEDSMFALERSEGDYFRDNRYVEIPGIDNPNGLAPDTVHRVDGLWSINYNFCKLASSAAHLFGRPQVWTGEGGGTDTGGKYQMDFQLVRGVTAFQIRTTILSGGSGALPAVPPETAMLAWYADRAGYLMAIGRPAAQVALYHPGNSIWMGDVEADHSTTKLGWELLQHQIDWDYFDEQSLSSIATIENGGFRNLSGQIYKAIVMPSTTVITRTGLERLKAFAASGGKVIFVGNAPKVVVDKTFMDAGEAPDLSFATLIEPRDEITPQAIAALPRADVKLDSEFPRLTYTHRKWSDGDMYFFFNESNKAESRMAAIAGKGTAQDWDLATGEIHAMAAAKYDGDEVNVPLVLAPWETKVIVVGPLPPGVAAPEPSFASGNTIATLAEDWSLEMNGEDLTTPLKSWEQLRMAGFGGPAMYLKQFTLNTIPKGKRVYLEIGDLHDYALVTVNGKPLGARSWQPYRWDVTSVLRPGSNQLVIQVDAPVESREGTSAAPAASAQSAPPAGVSGLSDSVQLVAR